MTAPALNLPIISTVTGGRAPVGAAAQGPAAGFEALLATLFGAQGDQGAGDLLGEGKAGPTDGVKDPLASDDQTTPAISTEAMALAAMLAVPAAQAQTPPTARAEDGDAISGDGKAKAEPAVPFTGVPAQPAAPAAQTKTADAKTAPVAEQAASPATDSAALEAALAAVTDGAAETAPAAEDVAKPANAIAPEAKPAAEAPKAPQQAHQPASQAKAPEPAKAEAPAPVEVAAQAAAPEVEAQAAPAEPVAQRPAAKSAKPADAQRRDPELAAGQPPVDDAASPVAVKPVAGPSGGGAANVDQDAPAAAPAREAKVEAKADTPDFQPAAPAAPQAAQSAAAHAPPVRATPETVAHLTAQISKNVEGRSTKFDVQLTPAGLGHVNVSVEIAASGKMTAAMSFESPQAAAEVRARSHELQRALEQAGFDLSGGLTFDVAGERGDGRGQAQQQQQQSDGAAWRGRAFQAVLGTAGEVVENATSLALNYGRRSASGVDVRI